MRSQEPPRRRHPRLAQDLRHGGVATISACIPLDVVQNGLGRAQPTTNGRPFWTLAYNVQHALCCTHRPTLAAGLVVPSFARRT